MSGHTIATRTSVAEAIASWEAKGPTSLTVALVVDALYGVREAEPLPTPQRGAIDRPPCGDCGPGYRLGDDGCRHDGETPPIGATGICRTCAQPIWWEEGEIGHRKLIGWSDRIERGGDSVVCFKAVGYRHVPMGAREAAIYEAGRNSVTTEPHPVSIHTEWAVQKRCYPLGVGIRLYGDDETAARAAAPKVIGTGADVLCRTVVEYAPRVSEWRVIPADETEGGGR